MKRLVQWLSVFALAFFVASAAQAQDQTAASANKPAAASQSTAAKPKTPQKDPALLHPETLKAKAPEEFDAKFVTTKGEFVIHVTRAWSPMGADRFYNLVKNHFFDGVSFFRVHPGFMVQFGMSGEPKINAAWEAASIKDDPVKQSNKPGYITYAMSSAPNSRTTQVFINYADNSFLDAKGFAPFGQVISGMDVVQQIYSGYGEIPDMGGRGPSPSLIASEGKAYLAKNFPKLDSIRAAVIVAAPATAPAATAKPKD